MNILHITNHLDVGGITSYVFTLASGLKKRGHNVYVASSGGELLGKFQAAGIIYIPIPIRTKKEISPGIIFSALKLSGIIRKYKIDIIHTHSRTTQVLGWFLHKLTRRARVFTCHGFFKRRILRSIFPCWGEGIIAISGQVKEHLIRDFKVPEKDIAVINNGIDIDRFKAAALKPKTLMKKSLGLSEGPVIGIIARLSDVKGHKYLITAMKEVLVEYPAAQLLMMGTGKMQEDLNGLAASLGISKSVFFIPEISDTVDALSAMDIFVMPSLQEGLGLALMEAMAAGLAVIGSNVGGIKTLIQDRQNGLLAKPADSEGLASAILNLLGDPSKREALGKQAQDFIQHNFSQDKMVMETEKEYLTCLNAKD
ncbi:MAG: glycosyltransferase family 4 protein [Candidatus Omnitrophica bacterium]|nr:glycosyltransferase family 4 protein [Candidatus Omnitrophota bacterium]